MRRLLLIFGAYVGICCAIAWVATNPRSRKLTSSPRGFGMGFTPVTFRSSDETHLSGWIVPAAAKSHGIIIMCHGVDSTRESLMTEAKLLHDAGYALFMFDFRARGESGGKRCTLGFRETDDLLAAVRYIRSRPDFLKAPIGVLGQSQGAAVAIMGTARTADISAVCAESPYARLDHAVGNHFHNIFGVVGPLFGVPTRWVGELLIGRRCADIAPINEIQKVSPRPLLLIQDEADTLCPPSETNALYGVARQPKQLWSVAGAGHVGASTAQPDEYRRRIVAFFQQSMK